VAIRLNNQAKLPRATNRLAEAEPPVSTRWPLLKWPMDRRIQRWRFALNNLAVLLQDTNRLAEAEPPYRRALAIDEAAYGPMHPTVAICLNNFAMLLYNTNRLAEAESLHRRALAIDEAARTDASKGGYRPQQPGGATACNQPPGGSRTLYRHALAIDEAAYGPTHPEVAQTSTTRRYRYRTPTAWRRPNPGPAGLGHR
jgi:tetratricopeptide (TPR) repeat protein